MLDNKGFLGYSLYMNSVFTAIPNPYTFEFSHKALMHKNTSLFYPPHIYIVL